MDPRMLYENPFTDIAPSGPEQVFSIERATSLIGVIEHFNQSAADQVA